MAKAEEYIKAERKLSAVRVTNNEEISPGVFLISWKRTVDFRAGQVVQIAMNETDQARIYSVCSGTQEAGIRVLFNVKEGGELTPRLSACIPGDLIWVSQPYGSFTDDRRPAWWIATGTGLAPFYSMFRSGLDEHKMLIHGARFLNQFYFEDELDWALGNKYVRCCSQQQSCDVFPGRVTDYLKQCERLPLDVRYFICGKALMVVEVRDLLIERGIPYENIIAEIYF